MTDDTELRRAAEAATKGPWFEQDFTDPVINSDPRAQDVTVSCTWPDHIGVAQMCGGIYGHKGLEQARKDAAYIAAASPDVVLRILDERDRLREALALIKHWASEMMTGRASYIGAIRDAARSALEDK